MPAELFVFQPGDIPCGQYDTVMTPHVRLAIQKISAPAEKFPSHQWLIPGVGYRFPPGQGSPPDNLRNQRPGLRQWHQSVLNFKQNIFRSPRDLSCPAAYRCGPSIHPRYRMLRYGYGFWHRFSAHKGGFPFIPGSCINLHSEWIIGVVVTVYRTGRGES